MLNSTADLSIQISLQLLKYRLKIDMSYNKFLIIF